MSMYLPNPDVHPTGLEPVEYIDVSPVPGGGGVGPFVRDPLVAPVAAPVTATPVPADQEVEGVKPLSSEEQPWLARVVAMARRTGQAISSPAYYLGRPAARWRRALGPRRRR